MLIRPISGVTGPKGGQTRFDVQFDLGREYISIEVKKSMYQDPCNTWQAESHLIATVEGTSTGGRDLVGILDIMDKSGWSTCGRQKIY